MNVEKQQAIEVDDYSHRWTALEMKFWVIPVFNARDNGKKGTGREGTAGMTRKVVVK